MYPDGFATRLAPEGAAKAGLEDEFRPHFFGGVATVVAKLFTQVSPDFALFGQKDYQQLRVVTQMAKRSRSAGEGHRSSDRARAGRPGVVLAQCLSLGGGTRGRANALSRAEGVRRAASRSGEKIDRVLNVGRIEIDARRLCAGLS